MSISINRLSNREFGSDEIKEQLHCRGRSVRRVRRADCHNKGRFISNRNWYSGNRAKRESNSPFSSSSDSFHTRSHARPSRSCRWVASPRHKDDCSSFEITDDDSWRFSTDEDENAPRSIRRQSQRQRQYQYRTPRNQRSETEAQFLKLEGFRLSQLNGRYSKCSMRKNNRACYSENAGFLLWWHANSESWVVSRNHFEYKFVLASAQDMARSPLEITSTWVSKRSRNDRSQREPGVKILEDIPPSFKVGSTVSCKYRDGNYHKALIVGKNENNTYRVRYLDDGLEAKSVPEINLKQDIFYARGDRLQAWWGGSWHEVRIADASKAPTDSTYHVEWLDSKECKFPGMISANRLRCVRSSLKSLNVDGMIAKLQSLSQAVDENVLDITMSKQRVDEFRKCFEVMLEDSTRYEHQLELKVEKCTYYAEDFAKRNTDNKRSVDIRQKKLESINDKLKEEEALIEKTKNEIEALQEKMKACKQKVEGLKEVKNREEKFLKDVSQIRSEVQEESVQVEAEKLSLTRTLNNQQDKMRKAEKSLAKVSAKIDHELRDWCKTWPTWSPNCLKGWIMTLGDGHFSRWSREIAKKIDDLQLDGAGLSKVNDLVLKQFGLPDDEIGYLLEEINDLTSGQGGGSGSLNKRNGAKAAGDGHDKDEKTQDVESSDLDSDDDHLCVVCISAPKTHICVPCGHKCCCQNCIDRIGKDCPICRKSVQMCIKIFD